VKWPRPEQLLRELKAVTFPDIDVITFEAGHHYDSLPWIDRVSGHQLVGIGNPIRTTAAHLARDLPNQSRDLQQTYFLMAYCWDAGYNAFKQFAIAPLLQSLGSRLGEWWNSNASHVLPPTHTSIPQQSRDLWAQDEDWLNIVKESATAWSTISQECAIIRIPSLMDPHSEELRTYEAYVRNRTEEREHAEYLRLKCKYEPEHIEPLS
jgi:hypothetical protein